MIVEIIHKHFLDMGVFLGLFHLFGMNQTLKTISLCLCSSGGPGKGGGKKR